MKRTLEQKYALAKQLVEWFGKESDQGPCACLGIECRDLGCYLWWTHFLDLSPSQFRSLLESGTKHAYDVKEDFIPMWLFRPPFRQGE